MCMMIAKARNNSFNGGFLMDIGASLLVNHMYILKRKLEKNGELLLRVEGLSMLPLIKAGDYVKVIRAKNIQVGDVAVYCYKGELVIHRIIDIKNEVLFGKGDNAFKIEDFPIIDFLGKVECITRRGKIYSFPKVGETFIRLSLDIGHEFVRLGRDSKLIEDSVLYKEFVKCTSKFELEEI